MAFALPLTLVTGLLMAENDRRIDFTENELRGIEYLRPLSALLLDISAHRTLNQQVLAGERPAADLRVLGARVDADVAALTEVDARLGTQLRTGPADLNSSASPATLARKWRTWKVGQPEAASNDAAHSLLSTDVRTLMDYVGVTSNLVLDPKLSTYHTADALVVKAPELVVLVTRLGDMVEKLIVGDRITLADRTNVASILALLSLHADELQRNLFTMFRDGGTLAVRDALRPHLYAAYQAVTSLITLTTRGFVHAPAVQLDRLAYVRAVQDTVDALSGLWTALFDQESAMLQSRRASDAQDRTLGLWAMLAALGLTAVLTVLLSRRITTDVGTVSRAAVELAGGDLTRRVRVRSRDEIGAMATAFNGMADRLQDMVDRLQDMVEEQERAQRTLLAERDFVDAVLDVAGSLVLVLDRHGRIVRFNRACETTLGYQFAEVRSRPYWELFLPQKRVQSTAAYFRAMSASDFPSCFESVWVTRDGDRRLISWSNAALIDEGGNITHVIATGIDITAGRAAELELREARERFRKAFDNASIGMCLVNLDARFMQVNPALCDMLGYSEEELLGLGIADVTHPDDLAETMTGMALLTSGERAAYHLEKRYLRADGQVLWALVTASVVHSERSKPLYMVTQIEDITDRRAAQAQLVYQAMHDSLTGLPNRALLMDRLRQELSRSGRRPALSAVLFIDLDGFKAVNDSLGHEFGDRVLREVAGRLQRNTRPSDTVARLGGDEFVVLCQETTSEQNVVEISERLVRALAYPIVIDTSEVGVTASLGIALAAGPDTKPEDLLRDADTAMYRAKSRGKNRWEIFDESLRERALDRVGIESCLRRGLRDRHFVLHHQPVVDLRTGTPVSVESLVRLDDPDRGMLAPGAFIEVAEEGGLIVPIGTWVLAQACRELADWRASGAVPPDLRIAVNLSVRQATRPDLVDTVTGALAEAGIEPEALALELTESVLMEADTVTLRQLESIRDLGVRLGIDDFGTGYSSLTYLKRLPVSFIKVDRSFVNGLVHDSSDREIVTAVIRLGQALGLTTIAEGVEDADQLALLTELGCDQVQGYLLGRGQAGPPRYRVGSGAVSGPAVPGPALGPAVEKARA